PGSADQAADFTFHIDWDGDGTIDSTVSGPAGTTLAHTFLTTGSDTVRVTATDKDGASTPNPLAASQAVAVTTVALEVDPVDSTKTDLAVGGGAGGGQIVFKPLNAFDP